MIVSKFGECLVIQDGAFSRLGTLGKWNYTGLWIPDPTDYDVPVDSRPATQAVIDTGLDVSFPAWDYLTARLGDQAGEIVIWRHDGYPKAVQGGDPEWRYCELREFGTHIGGDYRFSIYTQQQRLYDFDCSTRRKVAV